MFATENTPTHFHGMSGLGRKQAPCDALRGEVRRLTEQLVEREEYYRQKSQARVVANEAQRLELVDAIEEVKSMRAARRKQKGELKALQGAFETAQAKIAQLQSELKEASGMIAARDLCIEESEGFAEKCTEKVRALWDEKKNGREGVFESVDEIVACLGKRKREEMEDSDGDAHGDAPVTLYANDPTTRRDWVTSGKGKLRKWGQAVTANLKNIEDYTQVLFKYRTAVTNVPQGGQVAKDVRVETISARLRYLAEQKRCRSVISKNKWFLRRGLIAHRASMIEELKLSVNMVENIGNNLYNPPHPMEVLV